MKDPFPSLTSSDKNSNFYQKLGFHKNVAATIQVVEE